MPQVPLYGPRKVDTRPLAGVKRTAVPSPESFGAGFGDTLTRVAVATADPIIQAQRDKADQMVVLEASNANAQWEADTLHHPTTGVLNTRKGKNAMGLPEEVLEGYEQFSNKLAERLTNDRQRLAFARIQAQTRDQIRSQVYTHVEREMNVFYDEQAKAGVGLRVSGAIQAYENPAVSSQKMQEAVAITVDHLKGKGASDDTIRDAVLGVTSSVHEGVINQMLAVNQDQAAKVYFEEYNAAGQIDGDALQRITKSLEIGSLRGESQRESDRIIAEGGTPTEMIAKADTIKDPEVRDETRQRVEHHISTARALKNQAKEDMLTAASQIVFKTKRFDAIPPHMLGQMDSGDLERLQNFADSLQPGGKAIKTVWPEYYKLKTMATADVEQFKSLNLMKYLDVLGTTELKEMIDLQTDQRAGKKTPELDGYRSVQQTVDDVLHAAGIDTGDTVATREGGKDSTQAKVAAFRQEMDRRVALAQSGGTKVSNEDVRQIANDLLTSVVLGTQMNWRNVFPGGAPLFEDVTKRKFQLTLADVPALDQKQIADALTQAGLQPTPDAIVNMYVKRQRELGRVK